MRRILVTGANKGIGLAIVEAILEQEADSFVLLGSRNANRGAGARQSLIDEHPQWASRLEVLEIDVADDASVAAAAAKTRGRFAGEETPMYGVVNNAGIGIGDFELQDVLEVNTLGMRRVSEAFVPLLQPGDGRVVNVTSASGPSFVEKCSPNRRQFFLDALEDGVSWPQLASFIDECVQTPDPDAFAAKGLANGEPYGLSKACANTYTLMLAREHPNLQINACTPGFIATDLTRPYAESVGKTPAEMGMKAPKEGTRAPLHLLFGELEGTGRYYGSDGQRSPLDRYRAPGSPAYTGDP